MAIHPRPKRGRGILAKLDELLLILLITVLKLITIIIVKL